MLVSSSDSACAAEGHPSAARDAMLRLPPRRRVVAALALIVAAACVSSSSSHPLDPFHDLEDDPATPVVRGPGSFAKEAEASSGTSIDAADVVATAVDSWQPDARVAPLVDVAPADEESHPRDEDGGNTDDAVEALSGVSADEKPKANDDETNEERASTNTTEDSNDAEDESPPCAPCDGCSVDWVVASRTAQDPKSSCRGHGVCGSCVADLRSISGTYGLKQFPEGVTVKRETGASAATVLRAGNIFSKTERMEGMMEDGASTDAGGGGFGGDVANALGNASAVYEERGASPNASQVLGRSPFVKFVCIPGLPRHDTECKAGAPLPQQRRLIANTQSLQRLSDFCGLESISTRSWVAEVVGTAPAGLPLDPWKTHPHAVPVNQTAIFSSPAKGIALSALCSRPVEGPRLLAKAKSWEVTQAALFDFVFCAGDRHTQNVYVSEDASITLIDNDNLLGEQVYKPETGLERKCAVSSLFIPGTMESWRLRRSKFCGNLLGTLDYRCHVGPSGDVALPSKLETCLRHFAESPADALKTEFGMLELAYAETLRARSSDLLEFGFAEAIRLAGEPERLLSEAKKSERPVGKLWEELEEDEKAEMMAWRESVWRPTEPAVCHGLRANWEDAPFDYRKDRTFVGGNATADATGAQTRSFSTVPESETSSTKRRRLREESEGSLRRVARETNGTK